MGGVFDTGSSSQLNFTCCRILLATLEQFIQHIDLDIHCNTR